MAAPPDLTRSLGLAVLALLLIVSIVPPETSGGSLGACALLVALATVVAAVSGRLSARVVAMIAALPALALLGRFGAAPGSSVEPIAVVVIAAAACAAAAAARSDGLIDRAAATLALAGAIVGARAAYEAVWGLTRLAAQVRGNATLIPDAAAIAGRLDQGRAYAGFATPAAAGGFLVLAMCATVPLALVSAGRKRWLFVAAAALQSAGLLATRSLTAAAALLLALLIALAALRSRRVAAAAAALVLGIALIGAIRAEHVFSSTSGDNPWRLRAGNVRIALAIASARPWLGAGPGGYAEEFPRYRQPGDNESRHAHCLPAELVADLGWVPGLAVSALFFGCFLGPLISGFLARGLVERGMAVGLAAFALHNLADFTAFLPSVLWAACLVRGGLARPKAVSVEAGTGLRLAWTGCTLTAAAVLAFAGWSADAREAARRDVLLGDAVAAAREADRAVAFAPWSADSALLRAQSRVAQRRTPEELASAISDADRAVRLAPSRAAAHDVRAGLRALAGDVPGAFADLAKAASLHPLRAEYAARKAQAEAALPRAPMDSRR